MRLRRALAPTLGVIAATAVAPALAPPAQAAMPDLPTTTHAAPANTGSAANTASAGSAAARTAWAARVVALVRAARHVGTPGVAAPAGPVGLAVRPGPVGLGVPAGAAGPAGRGLLLPGPEAGRQPRCGKASDPDFPIDTRIHGGPRSYRAGGGPGTWYLDLTNTTADACHDIHPVIVLVDRARVLKPSQVKLQMSDGGGKWRTLSLERSDEDETLGILDDGSPGFAVPAGRTVTVRARLTFARGTRPNTIEVNSATVQRRGDDGDWVGKSNSYRFSVGRVDDDTDPGVEEDVPAGRPSGHATGRPDGSATDRPADPGTRPRGDSSAATRPGVGGLGEETPAPGRRPGDASAAPRPESPELAATGPGGTLARSLAAGALLAAGGGLFVAFRRRRARRV
ncbi:hypothetical protein [Streptomyces liangshanensis]|uniref:LPXTG cell wall anchor domain-containing protein n=1 Tax=Streptomyces liangshanensis TaxID=2717324 RepID=A0A6G9H2W9_9ACTN|nr:hypothetical protein [Streptomyces liangshanensis]QIQ04666.1 hypothetical protein HA039_22370 [Streptomyces liangshanensis]